MIQFQSRLYVFVDPMAIVFPPRKADVRQLTRAAHVQQAINAPHNLLELQYDFHQLFDKYLVFLMVFDCLRVYQLPRGSSDGFRSRGSFAKVAESCPHCDLPHPPRSTASE